jgi:hypothetical protein
MGLGVRFIKLAPGSRAVIFHAVDRLIQEGLEPYDPDQPPTSDLAAPPVAEPEPEPAEAFPFSFEADLLPLSPGPATETALEGDDTLRWDEPLTAGPEADPLFPVDLDGPGSLPDPEPRVAAREPRPAGPPAGLPLEELVARASVPEPPPREALPAYERYEPYGRSSGRFEPAADQTVTGITGVTGAAFVERREDRARWLRVGGLMVLLALAAGVLVMWPRGDNEAEVTAPEGSAPVAERSPAPVEPMTENGPAEPVPATIDPLAATSAPPPAVGGAGQPAPPPTITDPSAGFPLTRLTNISVQRLAGGTEVVLEGDGTFTPRTYAHFQLGGPNPRTLIKLRGIREPFARSFVPVGSPEVRQVRTGYHPREEESELHVVLDLAGPGIQATDVRAQGSTLRILLANPRG